MEPTVGEVLEIVSDQQKYLKEISYEWDEALPQILSIPRNSFIASRLAHFSSSELSTQSKVTLLGGIPQQWFNERKSFFWDTVRKIKSKRRRHFIRAVGKLNYKPVKDSADSQQESFRAASLSPHSISLLLGFPEDASGGGSKGERRRQNYLRAGSSNSILENEVRYTSPPQIQECVRKDTETHTWGDESSRETTTNSSNLIAFSINDMKVPNQKIVMRNNEKCLAASSYLAQDERLVDSKTPVTESLFSDTTIGPIFRKYDKSDLTKSVSLRCLKPEPIDQEPALLTDSDSSYEEDIARRGSYLEKVESVRSMIDLNLSNYLARMALRGSGPPLEEDIGNIVLAEKLLVMTVTSADIKDFSLDFTTKSRYGDRKVSHWNEYLVIAAEVNSDSEFLLLQFFRPRRRIGNKNNNSSVTDMKHVRRLDIFLHPSYHVSCDRLSDKTISLKCPYSKVSAALEVSTEHLSSVCKLKSTTLRFTTVTSCSKWYSILQQRIAQTKVSHNRLTVKIAAIGLTLFVNFPKYLIQILQKMEEMESKYLDIGYCKIGYKSLPNPKERYIIVCILKSLRRERYSNFLGYRERYNIPFPCTSGDCSEEKRFQGMQPMFLEASIVDNHQTIHCGLLSSLSTSIKSDDVIPPEVTNLEGFLLLLTNKYGEDRIIFGQAAVRLTFIFTVDNLLFLTQSYKATPIFPPDIPTDENGLPIDYDQASDAVKKFPSSFLQDPYPLDSKEHIEWLSPDVDSHTFKRMDLHSRISFNRRVVGILDSGCVLEICNIRRVYLCDSLDMASSLPKCQVLQYVSSITWGVEVTIEEVASSVLAFDMNNGITMKLLAPSPKIAREWVEGLQKLCKPCIQKNPDIPDSGCVGSKQDTALYLQHEEGTGIDTHEDCDINVSGKSSMPIGVRFPTVKFPSYSTVIYRGHLSERKSKHNIFSRYLGVLIPGYIVLYSISDNSKPTVWNRKYKLVPLTDCYTHVGVLTETGLSRNGYTTDEVTARNNGLPRIYSDGLKNNDDISRRCFSLHFFCGGFHRRYRNNLAELYSPLELQSYFNDHREKKQKQVKSFSEFKFGRRMCMTFIVRSRLERDIWMAAITAEVERSNANGFLD